MSDPNKYGSLLTELDAIESQLQALVERNGKLELENQELLKKSSALSEENSELLKRVKILEEEIGNPGVNHDLLNNISAEERKKMKIEIKELISRIDGHLDRS